MDVGTSCTLLTIIAFWSRWTDSVSARTYAGVRVEEIAALTAEIAKAKSRLEYAEAQLTRTATLARGDNATQQAFDQAENDVAARPR